MRHRGRRPGRRRYRVYFEAFVHESIIFFANTPFAWAPHYPPSSPTLLRTIAYPSDPPFYYNIYHALLVMAISCKVPRRETVGRCCELAYTRYSFICFCVCKNQSRVNPLTLYPRPFALPILLQYVFATFVHYTTSLGLTRV